MEDSFERAYTFLSSISETAPSSVRYIDALAEYILSGNLDDTMVYARHVDDELEKDTQSREARAICMNDLLKKLEESLLSIKPVSYTHLDVYKRQASYGAEELLYRPGCWF